jgi:hypothetical protein
MASNYDMDGATFKSTMSSINQGSVMAAAARNLQKELLREQAARPADPSRAVVDVADLAQVRGLAPARCGPAWLSALTSPAGRGA